MPYRAHFRLNTNPFNLTPDTDLYYPNEDHEAIRTSLAFAVDRGDGIVKVSGEVGTGKTLLSRLLIADISAKNVDFAYLINPQEDPDWIIGAVCREFGVDPESTSDPFHALNEFLIEQFRAKNRGAVVIVDEAQALGEQGLEAVHRLSNLETEKHKLLQIVLFGQFELDRVLAQPSLRQFKQRIEFSFAVHALPRDSVIRYVRYRIACACDDIAQADKLFEDKALDRIARMSGGNPRVINILADKSLIAAFGHGATRVAKQHVREAVADSREIIAGSKYHIFGWSPWRTISISGFGIFAAAAKAWSGASGAGGAHDRVARLLKETVAALL
jgi:MSHA biogenesis protein MshM